MAFNKAKTLATAKRYIEKGNLKKAIVQYERLVAAEPADIKTRVGLADLQHKHGDMASALRTYHDVASQFADEGLLLKSVAVFKQMLRLDHGLHSVHVALARVYQQLGLVNDAISQYQRAIRVLNQRRQTVDALYVIRELLDLDPDNIRGRVRLAEDFFAEGKSDDGVRELRLALETLDRDGANEQFMRVAERLLHHQPEDAVVSRRLAELVLDEDNPQAALPRLQACFRAHPHDVEVLDMLARCFNQLGQSHKALTVLKELARIHVRNGLVEERNEALRQVLSLDPSDRSARKTLDKRPDEVGDVAAAGFDEIAFEELEDEPEQKASGSSVQAFGAMTGSALTPSASFDDLEALAEMVASEPVSNPDIVVDKFDAPAGPADDDGEDMMDFEELEALAGAADEDAEEPDEAEPPPLEDLSDIEAFIEEESAAEQDFVMTVDAVEVDEADGAVGDAEVLQSGMYDAVEVAPALPEPDTVEEAPELPVDAEPQVEVVDAGLDDLAPASAFANTAAFMAGDGPDGPLELDGPEAPTYEETLEYEDDGKQPVEEPAAFANTAAFGSDEDPAVFATDEPAAFASTAAFAEDEVPAEVAEIAEIEVAEEPEDAEEVEAMVEAVVAEVAQPYDEFDKTLEDGVDLNALDLSDLDLDELQDDGVTELDEVEIDIDSDDVEIEVLADEPEVEIALDDGMELTQPPGPLPAAVVDELQEFDFYMKNGLADAARSVLDDLGPEFASHPDVVLRRARLKS